MSSLLEKVARKVFGSESPSVVAGFVVPAVPIGVDPLPPLSLDLTPDLGAAMPALGGVLLVGAAVVVLLAGTRGRGGTGGRAGRGRPR